MNAIRGNATFIINDASNAGQLTNVGSTANVRQGFDPWSFQVGLRHHHRF